MTIQQGDVLLYHETRFDAGNINVQDGITEMTGGLATALYLSILGGNEEDDGSPGNAQQWWGNFDEPDPARQQRSELQHLLRSLPSTSNNLRLLEDAGRRDVQWALDQNVVNEIEVVATIPELNAVCISIKGSAQGQEFKFNFTENWKASL